MTPRLGAVARWVALVSRRSALAWVLIALGCASAPEVTRLPEGDPRPGAFLAAHAERVAARQGLRARTRVSVRGAHAAPLSRQLLLLERPARMRVEVLGLMGQRTVVLATDGVAYDLFTQASGRVERGPVHPGVLAQVAGLPITPEAAVRLLLGLPALPAAAAPGSARLAGERIALRWSDGEPALLRSAEFDPAGHLRRFEVARAGEGVRLVAQFDDYRELPGGPFAHRVGLHFPAEDAAVEVRFDDVELDPDLPASLFRLEVRGRVSSEAGGDE